MLHVANGEATSVGLRTAWLPGEVLDGDDILMEGPVPHALRDEADWRVRARWLDERLGIPAAAYLEAREEAESRVAKAEGEVVLWSEEDVFCQVNLLRTLTLLGPAAQPRLVCPPGVRLGGLATLQLAALFERRVPVPGERVALAREAWQAYGAADPRTLARLVATRLDAWPAMRDALALHLQRFPSVESGLGLVEEEVLTLAGDGPVPFDALFQAFGGSPRTHALGMGDVQLVRHVLDLREAGLLEIVGDVPARPDATAARGWVVRTTTAGEAVLAGDAVASFPLPRWLGGVQLGPGLPAWRRDGDRLVRG